MLPTHMLRMIKVCVSGDYTDPAVRERIKRHCIPTLSKHRREVLGGSYAGRHVRPAGFMANMLDDAQLIRRTLAHAHRHLLVAEPVSNVVSFASFARRPIEGATAKYDIAVGSLEHVKNGMCPDTLDGYETRDDEHSAWR